MIHVRSYLVDTMYCLSRSKNGGSSSWLRMISKLEPLVYNTRQRKNLSLWIKPTDALNSTFIGITTLYVSGSLSAHHQEFLTAHRLWYILRNCDRLLPEVGWNFSILLLLPINLEFNASVGFIHKKSVTMHDHTIVKKKRERESYSVLLIKLSLSFWLIKYYSMKSVKNGIWAWRKPLFIGKC
jgi:hypothetical protein